MIYNYDPRYTIAQFFTSIALRLNFRKFVFVGKRENVSKKKPVIFAPNHRNALIDALLFVYSGYWNKQVVFLARADIFKQKFIAWILRGLRILPVYRIRDGKDNLEKNTEIFENAGRILKKNNPIALFPEARHNPKQSLLPIQKAVPRIVLPTEAQYDFSLNSQIVPVAIYYRDMFAFLSDAYVRYGTPIEVSKYKNIYAENPHLAVNQLREELEDALKSMVVNIWNDEYYNQYQLAIDFNGDRIAKEMFSGEEDDFVQAAQYIVKRLDDMFENDREAFDNKMADINEACSIIENNGLNSKDDILNPKSKLNIIARYVVLTMSAPIAFFGFVNAIFPILINNRLYGLFKDKQFIPSVRLVSGLLFIPIFSGVQSIVIGSITVNWLLSLVYFIAMPATFYFACYWRKWLKKASRDWKVSEFVKKNDLNVLINNVLIC
ncbi:MAG: 1-acyl-sn-glycerol-3-phosphate acyltransferase [Dysgonamonadaceae bacterium]|jgi:1-acyl-sn-glycerol-3-phosphate acyltransferase|nr:1-acyl-sn-glycerol-3-phosphate acyltransferase [Dysgonamonadaceae bacterium]